MKFVTTILTVLFFCTPAVSCLAQDDAAIPAKFTSNIGQLVGQWTTKGKYNDEEIEGTYSAAWNRNQTCLLLTSSSTEGEFNGIGGWDPATDDYVETWYRADGVRFEQRFKLDSRNSWSGNVVMSTPDGKQDSGDISLSFRENGVFDFEGRVGAVVLIQTSTRTSTGMSTRAEFEEFVEAFQGRWVGQVTWVADWKGIGGKKGDKVTSYADVKSSSDGNLLHSRWYGGDSSANWVVFYDAGENRIRGVMVDSGGLVQREVFWKDGSNWRFKMIGSQADGSKVNATGTVEIADGGKQHTWTGTITINGKPTDPLKDIYRRITDH